MKKITCVSLITAATLACVPSAGAAGLADTDLRSSWSKSSWTAAPVADPRSRFEAPSEGL